MLHFAIAVCLCLATSHARRDDGLHAVLDGAEEAVVTSPITDVDAGKTITELARLSRSYATRVASALQTSSSMRAGQLVGARYRLQSLLRASEWPSEGVKDHEKEGVLGVGGFGETWAATNTETGARVAIKFFIDWTKVKPEARPADGEYPILTWDGANEAAKIELGKAKQECVTAKQIIDQRDDEVGRSRICQCLEDKVENGASASYLVMEMCGDTDLIDFDPLRGLNEKFKVYVKMVIEGLRQMQGNFVHRDIKGQNIAVDKDEQVARLIDFGLTVPHGEPRIDGTIGTEAYIAPESRLAQPADLPAMPYSWEDDVYALGSTISFLVCGAWHFQVGIHKFLAEHDRSLYPQGPAGENKMIADFIVWIGQQRATDLCHIPDHCQDTCRSDATELAEFAFNNMLCGRAQRTSPEAMLASEYMQGISTS